MKKLVVCGGGNSAHILIPLLEESIFDVYVYTSRPQEWSSVVELEWQDGQGMVLDTYTGHIKNASNNRQELFSDADYVVFCMPVHKYRVALHEIAPYLNRDKNVFVCTCYGQGGWNWMVNEIKRAYNLPNLIPFAFGLIPWICRIAEYGKKGITYGIFKKNNFAAVSPQYYFRQITEEFINPICHNRIVDMKIWQSPNFLSLTLSVDNQIIHTSRCYGLYKVHGLCWDKREDIPWFYKDYDDISAQLLCALDSDYSCIRNEIRRRFPNNDYSYMRDYMELERFGYESGITDIKASFVDFGTLGTIQTPVVKNKDGKWEIDNNYRFFLDDIYYGNCIAKWMAERMDLTTPTIDNILRWAQLVRKERIIDSDNHLVLDSPDLTVPMKTGIPSVYGFTSIEDCID